jgi:hypothetical protein
MSFIIRYLGWRACNRFWGHLSEIATILSSGLPQRNAPNGIPRPWRVYQYESSEATTIPSSGTGVSRGGFHFAAAFSPANEAR